MFHPKRALVREPGNNYPSCISSHPFRHSIDLSRAREQHAEYCKNLSELGLEIITLPPNDELPDACFVEDTVVVHGNKALITRMAKESRRGEEDAVEEILKDYLRVRRAEAPATLEGGDVIHLPDRLICGVTQRTNNLGVSQMQNWLDFTVDKIRDPSIVHLKSYVTALDPSTMIATKTYANHHALHGLTVLVIPEEEWYAANTLTIGDTVLMPKAHPQAQKLVREAGFEVLVLDMNEFEKCEGALTCLSILF